jgi:hypothetical protein
LYGLPEKSSKKGNLCILLGYPEDHPSDTYRVLDLKTLGVMLTRNVRWTGKTYVEYFGEAGTKNMEGNDLESSDDESIVIKQPTESVNSTEEGKSERREAKTIYKFTMATRCKALMDTMEDKTSSDEDVKDSLMMVEEEIKKDPMKFENA